MVRSIGRRILKAPISEPGMAFASTLLVLSGDRIHGSMTIRIASLQRYPVKGLSPETLSSVALTKGDYFPGDRLFAVENGPAGFEPDNPQHQPKIKFLMLMRNESLARLKTRYIDS